MLGSLWGKRVKLIKYWGIYENTRVCIIIQVYLFFLFFKCLYFSMLNHNISYQKLCKKFPKRKKLIFQNVTHLFKSLLN